MKKVILVGAGMGSLAAAARLANAGLQVEIFESGDRVGGKCRTEWFGDYAFDTGPTLLTLPAVFKDLFKKSGKRFEKAITLSPIDPAFKYFFHDGVELTFPNLDLQKILREFDATLGKDAGNEWHNLMQRAEAMWDISRMSFIESEAPTKFALMKNRHALRDLKLISPWMTLSQISRKYSENPYLHKIVDRYATYTGSDPRKAPAVLLTIAFMETTFGAWHVNGGIGNLATELASHCESLGVTIHLNSPVQSVAVENGSVKGVHVDGSFIPSDAVIFNGDAQTLYNSLIRGDAPKASRERKRIGSLDSSLSGFSLYLGLNNSLIKDPENLPALAEHNVFFPEDYEAEFKDIFERKVPVEDPAIYICAPRDPEMVSGDNASQKIGWSILVNAPLHSPECNWDELGAAYAEKIIAKLDSLGLRVSERLEEMRFRTPRDIEKAFNAPGGAIYGGATHGVNAVFNRAKNRSPINGLYLVGGSTHPGGGLPMVAISGELVSEAILAGDLGVGISRDHH